LPRFDLEALYHSPWHSTVKYGTGLKIMVSPVRARVPPLLFSKHFQEKPGSNWAAKHRAPLLPQRALA
jgi:hypothetical protein